MKQIDRYFPDLSEEQRQQFHTMLRLYPEWNEKINVISRRDIDNLETHHLLHSLGIARFIKFAPGTRVLDLGTGGGLPGLPLAVIFPDTKFHLIDRIGKKLTVARDIAVQCVLKNVTFQHGDIGECHDTYDFCVSRAVMPQNDLMRLVRKNLKDSGRNALPAGILTLKGGNIADELKGLPASEIISLYDYFDDSFFETKKLVFTPKP